MKIKHVLAIIPTGFLSKTHSGMHVGNLAAAILRSITPQDIKIKLVDENLGCKIDFDSDADLVILLSVITSAAPKAYRIAKIFKNKGKIVGMGGPHPSVAPKEALEFCDFVGIGEMEGYWPNILKDVEKGKLKKIYENKEPVNLDGLPYPDRGILENMKKRGHKHNYLTTQIMYTTRGCPYGCAFCTVSNIYGKKYRTRPVKAVIDDILKHNGRKLNFAFFIDDNIWAVPSYAKELFREMIKNKVRLKWLSQASLTQAMDPELLKLAKKAGCSALYIGFESVNPESLKETNKGFNKPEEFIKKADAIRRAGIPIVGSFVFGFDSDTPESIKDTVEFAIKSSDFAQFCILTPFYNTVLYDRLKKENRILIPGEGGGEFHDNWNYYTFGNVVFKPKNMSPEKLKQLQGDAFKKFYDFKPLIRRMVNGLRCYPFIMPIIVGFGLFTRANDTQGGFSPKKVIEENIKSWEKEYGYLLKKN